MVLSAFMKTFAGTESVGALAAAPEDLESMAHTHMAAHSCL